MTSDRRVCDRCGEPIGAYERIYADYGDGVPVSTGWLGLGDDPAPRALWHADCGVPPSGRAGAREQSGATPLRRRRRTGTTPVQRRSRRVSL